MVSLVVYDVLGREVARLVQEELPAGTHRARFDARNGAGIGGFSRRTTQSPGEIALIVAGVGVTTALRGNPNADTHPMKRPVPLGVSSRIIFPVHAMYP